MAAVFWHDGRWYDENPKLTGPMDHAFWMASVAFDGARAFEGCAPDLGGHCRRLVDSTRKMLLEPTHAAEEIEELCTAAIRRLPKGAALYIRPMFYATRGFVVPDADSTAFVLAVYKTPMPAASGSSACVSRFRRPARDMAPTDAKASCLYPNGQRALKDAADRGYGNAIVLDANGNVAELATANLWIAKDGVAMTPVCNGTFLNGITRQRVIGLLREDGVDVRETTLTVEDVMDADEVFSTGNYGKVMAFTRIGDRDLQAGPVFRRAREIYFDWARGQPVA